MLHTRPFCQAIPLGHVVCQTYNCRLEVGLSQWYGAQFSNDDLIRKSEADWNGALWDSGMVHYGIAMAPPGNAGLRCVPN